MSEKTVVVSPEAEFNTADYRPLGTRDVEHLKDMARKSPRDRYRVCLHAEHAHLTQEMVICLRGFTYFPPHRHPGNRSESYHMIEGRMDVYLFDDGGELMDVVRLAAPQAADGEGRDLLYRLSAPLFHLMVPRAEWTIYHEVLTGPWSKDGVVQNAPFAPTEDQGEAVEEYVRQVTGMAPDALVG